MHISTSYSISEMAAEFGVTLRTLRFYEGRGLLSPARNGMARVYSEADRARFRKIHTWAGQGFTLAEIKAALAHGGFDRAQIIQQIADLRRRRDEADRAIAALLLQVAA